jgi:hypothetical protein
MDFIYCELFLNIDKSDPTTELLIFIDKYIDIINQQFVLNFNIFNKNNSNNDDLIKGLKELGIKGLPCMLCYNNNDLINAITGLPNICNYLTVNTNTKTKENVNPYYIKDGKIRSNGTSADFDEDAYRDILKSMLENSGDIDEDKDMSMKSMEQVKQKMTNTGLSDSNFQKAIARAKVGGNSFGTIAQERRDRTQNSHNSNMRGKRITQGRTSNKNKLIPINNIQNNEGIAYRGDKSFKSDPMGKQVNKVSTDIDEFYDLKSEAQISEESEKAYEKSIGLPTRKNGTTGAHILARLRNRQE